MTDFNALLRLLTENQVEFIIVGAAAATAHWQATVDLCSVVLLKRVGRDTTSPR